MAYDATYDALCAFGGHDGTVSNNTTYVMQLSSLTWTTASPVTSIPAARRSMAVWWDSVQNGMLISSGRPVSGQWFRDYTVFKPAYRNTNDGWYDRSPVVYMPTSVNIIGLTNDTGYHWQAWAMAYSVDMSKNSFGAGNSELVSDFIIGSLSGAGIKVWDGVSWSYKPLKSWSGTAWVRKSIKVWNGDNWITK